MKSLVTQSTTVAEQRSSVKVHPMAFEFVTKEPSALFFPTVHIHDGLVHPREAFDHALFFQTRRQITGAPARIAKSQDVARRFVDIERAQSVAVGDALCYKMGLHGERKNQDTFVRLAP